ncbi:MAG: hypothetical protein ACTSVB_03640 [Candidatus Heimdallarchaeaceae archaeon]|uniref:TFIIB-type domain-containing protein n=1 Tax=Candidatus Heimdallarchaeum endolithica TaxID=2876572 RepID=A0A9Y1BRT0_9ARCH|nr:MAG: hypothetical protein K9W46_00310 [Candidatus Heimdallarchaeum endolithica]
MARCPDCGGEVKYKAPFMVCMDCGLSFRRDEFEKMEKKIKQELKTAVGLSEEEKQREDREKKRSYYRWLMKREDED